MPTFRRIAPWLILGPVTGLLAEGVHRNALAGNPALAFMYAVATLFWSYDLALCGGHAIATLHNMMVP
jgi:hypothetical protein